MGQVSTTGLKSGALVRMIGICLEETDPPPGFSTIRLKELALADILSRPVAPDAGEADCRAVVWDRLSVIAPHSDRPTVQQALLDPATAVAILRALKEYGKSLAGFSDSGAEFAAATVLYYGAIAGALADHRERITRYSLESLADAFAKLELKDWIPPELHELFQRAGVSSMALNSTSMQEGTV